MTEKKFKKCDSSGLCEHLSVRISGNGFGNAKGFHCLNTVNLKTNAHRFLGVSYKMGGKDKGLMLNFCPFCGGQPGSFKRE